MRGIARVQFDLMASQAVHAVLHLLDANGTVLASDDNGGTGNNARIVKQLGAGNYTLVAATAAPGAAGPLWLSASRGNWTTSPAPPLA